MIVVKSYNELGRQPRPGDRVKIKDYPNGIWFSDEMKKYLSCIMTVREFVEDGTILGHCYMFEDMNDFNGNEKLGWIWEMCDIEGLVIEDYEDIVEDTSMWASNISLDVLLT